MIFTLDSTAYDRGTFQMPHLSVHTALNSPAIDGNISLRDVKRMIWKTSHETRSKETYGVAWLCSRRRNANPHQKFIVKVPIHVKACQFREFNASPQKNVQWFQNN